MTTPVTDLRTTRRSTLWVAVASVFTIVNVLGLPLALRDGEMMHAVTHVVLSVVGVFWLMYLMKRRDNAAPRVAAGEVDQRLLDLQRSLDSIAVEVERMGEAQRYVAKLAAEKQKAAQRKSDEPPR